LKYKKSDQAHIVLGVRAFDLSDSRRYVIEVLGDILGGGMSSRMFIQVRERRGLAYYVRASSGNYQDTGVFAVTAGVQVSKALEAVHVIVDELRKIKRYLVDDRELLKAKEYIKGKTTLALEDNQSRLDWYMEAAAFHSDMLPPKKFFEKIDRVTTKDVQAVARELFQNNKMTLALIGPYRSEKQFKKLLKV
jgi:predicted Zn-dependent peptidase